MIRQPTEPNVSEVWINRPFRNAVVSNYPTGHDSQFMLEVHQGHMVCENIADPRIGSMISKLPDLLRAVDAVLRPYRQDTDPNSLTPEMATLRDLHNQMV